MKQELLIESVLYPIMAAGSLLIIALVIAGF